eukprot:CAMPEP_0182598542 /NCGR_PEP_ID=MMETSP1324-20130603/88450_1 /TAXON_ID=236786 /ORGANISM="Florenciella sp., Strain RCC1587" /LENGTH=55 /DNA_ID=CAMNT_0024816379 /DNA_START=323 /DNA_END=490 /DNA_ORIENTATION=+
MSEKSSRVDCEASRSYAPSQVHSLSWLGVTLNVPGPGIALAGGAMGRRSSRVISG